jgi:glycosyltransferase involved in cell wall biosynthesis
LRILIAGQTYKPHANGQAVFTTQLAEGLASAGHNVVMLTPSNNFRACQEDRNGVRIEYLTAIPVDPRVPEARYAVMPGPRVGAIMDSFQPDMVHIQDHYPLSRTVHRLARRRGLSVVGTNHFMPANVIGFVMPFQAGRRLLTRFLWWTMLSIYRKLDAVTAPSRTAVAILKEQALDVPLHAISCGVSRERFDLGPDFDRNAMRREYGISETADVFVFVGRLDEEKHIEIAIKALRQARASSHFVIVGRGRLEPVLRQLAESLGVADRVVFTGYVPNDALPGLLTASDIFLMPSEAELQSIATLEAMATGRPVLAANAKALPELVEPGVNGYLFEPRDPADCAKLMDRLVDERDRWEAMGKASLERVAPHQVESTIQRYVRIYRRLLGVRHSLSEPASLSPAD